MTPVRTSEVLLAKWLMGVLLGSAMAVVTLTLNRAVAGNWYAVVLVVIVAAALATVIGLLVGVAARDSAMMLGIVKGMGLFLFAPALFYIFPDWPQWIAMLFPLYWIIEPIWEVAVMGEALSSVALELGSRPRSPPVSLCWRRGWLGGCRLSWPGRRCGRQQGVGPLTRRYAVGHRLPVTYRTRAARTLAFRGQAQEVGLATASASLTTVSTRSRSGFHHAAHLPRDPARAALCPLGTRSGARFDHPTVGGDAVTLRSGQARPLYLLGVSAEIIASAHGVAAGCR